MKEYVGTMNSAKVTVELPIEVHDKLARISAVTQRDLASLTAEAVTAYVDRQLPIIEKIQEGLDDVKAGRVFSHEEVMAGLQKIIGRAEAKRAEKG